MFSFPGISVRNASNSIEDHKPGDDLDEWLTSALPEQGGPSGLRGFSFNQGSFSRFFPTNMDTFGVEQSQDSFTRLCNYVLAAPNNIFRQPVSNGPFTIYEEAPGQQVVSGLSSPQDQGAPGYGAAFCQAPNPPFFVGQPVTKYEYDVPVHPPSLDLGHAKTLKVPTKPAKEKKKRMGAGDRRVLKVKELTRVLEQKLQQFSLLSKENEALHRKKRVLESVIDISNDHIDVVKDAGSPRANLDTDIVCRSFSGTRLIKMDPKTMGARDLVIFWRDFVRRIKGHLHGKSSAVPDPVLEKGLESAVHQCMNMLKAMWFFSPLSVYHLQSVNVDTGKQEQVDMTTWAAFIQAVGLEEQQRKDFVECYNLYCTALDKVREERTQLASRLQEVTCNRKLVTELADLRQQSSNAVTEGLHSNLLREYSIEALLQGYMWSVMTPMQLAHLTLRCYPYFPSAAHIGNVLASQEGA